MNEYKVTLYTNVSDADAQTSHSYLKEAEDRTSAVRAARSEHRGQYPNGAAPERVTARRVSE